MFLATIVKYCAKIDFSVEKQHNIQDKMYPLFQNLKTIFCSVSSKSGREITLGNNNGLLRR